MAESQLQKLTMNIIGIGGIVHLSDEKKKCVEQIVQVGNRMMGTGQIVQVPEKKTKNKNKKEFLAPKWRVQVCDEVCAPLMNRWRDLQKVYDENHGFYTNCTSV